MGNRTAALPATTIAGSSARNPVPAPLRHRAASPQTGRAPSAGAHLLMSGEEAMRVAAQVLATSHSVTVPSSFGDVVLRPGQLFSNERLLISPSWSTVYFTIGDRLYEMGTAAFLRDEWLNAMSVGMQKAAWLIPIAKAEMALLAGFFVPWYLMLGVACAKTTAIYVEHKDQFAVVWKHGPKALAALQKLRREHGTLFNKILCRIAQDTFTHLPDGVTGEDVGFFVGRVLHGIDGLPEVTIAAVIKVTASVAWKIALLHLPNVTAHAAEASAHARAEEFRAYLEGVGYTVTVDEAKTILKDAIAQRDLESTLHQLEEACKALAPSFQELENAIYE